MKSTEMFHIVGGGLFIGSIVAAGGVYDSRSGLPTGTPIVRMVQSAGGERPFADLGEALARVLAEHGVPGARFVPRGTTGYSVFQLRAAYVKLHTGERISVYPAGGATSPIWTGTMAEALNVGVADAHA